MKILLKMFLALLPFTIVSFFITITGSGIKLLVLQIIALIFFLVYTHEKIAKPLMRLYKALKVLDFNADVVDFTMVDSLEVSGSEELKEIIYKFKHLLDIIEERITMLNTERDIGDHDELTGLYNRQHFERVQSSYMAQNIYCICFIDVNNLKRMNDEFGHDAGDTLLKNVAKKLSFWQRYGDVYRLGGDEFMLVITNKPEIECLDMIKRWYATVGQLNRESDGFRCVLAYGVAFGYKYSSINDVIKRADEKMYSMKLALKKKYGESMR